MISLGHGRYQYVRYQHGRREPPCRRRRGLPLAYLCDQRLHRLSSPRRRGPQDRRARFHVEMGWRFVFGSSPDEMQRRDEDWQRLQQEETRD